MPERGGAPGELPRTRHRAGKLRSPFSKCSAAGQADPARNPIFSSPNSILFLKTHTFQAPDLHKAGSGHGLFISDESARKTVNGVERIRADCCGPEAVAAQFVSLPR